MHIETLWNNIKRCEGETFYTTTGKPYKYVVYNDYIMVENVKGSRITKDNLAKAITIKNPTPSKIALAGCWGPSYICGIITDKRVKDL